MKKIAFMIGDPAGIGPEITAKSLLEYKFDDSVQILLVGDRLAFGKAMDIVNCTLNLEDVTSESLDSGTSKFLFLDIPAQSQVPYGIVSKDAGESVYKSILCILDLISKKKVDGFVFAPFNKEAMSLGGCKFTSELELFKDYFNNPTVPGEINYMDPIWTNRVTSHIAVKDIASYIKKDRIVRTIEFLNTEMKRAHITDPRIAVAALNPHCGEKGLFGTEEGDEIEPAVLEAQKLGIDAKGPFPADTIFLRVKKGEFDAVCSMYHDQAQVATKLMGFDKGVTIHGGMPVMIATCGHGTAFDLAGTGKANPGALIEAIKVVEKTVVEEK